MTEYRHPDLDLPSVSLSQLKAIESVILRHLPADSALLELAVRPRSTLTTNPAPLEVRATVREPADMAIGSTWTTDLAAEIRAGWDRMDFQFSLHFVNDEDAE